MFPVSSRFKFSLIAASVTILTCRAGDEIEIPDISSILFNRDWGKNLRTVLDQNATKKQMDPVVIIYKDSGVSTNDDRAILVVPLFQKKTGNLLSDPIIASYEVFVIDPDSDFNTKKMVFQGGHLEKIESFWLTCSDLVLAAGRGEAKASRGERLESFDKYYIFSTLRSKDGIIFFSGHMAGVVENPVHGTKSHKMVVACDQIISTILPLE